MAPALVGDDREALTSAMSATPIAPGRPFWKLCGSGNDFVFFDARREPAGALATADAIRRLCARATGVGADGVVFLEPPDGSVPGATVRMAYYNADGSRASMCGNAALCTTRLAVVLGAAPADGFVIQTDVGAVPARLRVDEDLPEIELPPVRELAADAVAIVGGAGERRIGYARAGVPHLVLRVDDVDAVALDARGRTLRFDPSLADGANVNWVAPTADGAWRMRTYERGVEGETLACGTGAIACATVLRAWGESGDETVLVTSSGKPVRVRQPAEPDRGPTLAGEGRIVFAGTLGTID